MVLRKTQQGNNLDEELKDISMKQEYTINCNYSYMILELQLLFFLLCFLHVMFSNHIQLILFTFQVWKKRNKEGTLAEDHKVLHHMTSEKKGMQYFIMFS